MLCKIFMNGKGETLTFTRRKKSNAIYVLPLQALLWRGRDKSKQQVYDDRDKMQTNFEANKTTIPIQTTKFVPPNIKGKEYFPINFIKPASF